MYITRDNKHLHFHIPHLQFYLIVILILLTLILAGIAGYKYYKDNFYDSSLNGSEAKEQQQNTIPQDVVEAVKVEEQKISFPSATSIATTSAAIQISKLVHVPILMYHYVEYVKDKGDKTRASLNTTPDTLEQEVKTLKEGGYNFMTAGELAEVLDGKANLPLKPIVLTFDDGYRDFYTDAYPILKRFHAKATQYVISGFLNNSNHLTTLQLQEIAKDGLVEIGAHTVHHVWLKGQSLKKVSNEVFQSRVMLEKLINKPVISFAYPFGAFDEQAVQIVQDSGFNNAVSNIPGIDQKQGYRFFLYRLRPGGRTGKSLLDWLAQVKN